MNIEEIRSRLVLLVLGLYLILNYGFMLVRIPLSGSFALPMGEILILVFICTFLFEIRHLPEFARSVFLLPFLVWWALGFIRLIEGFSSHGVIALRDATHLFESLFIWIGFVVAVKPKMINRVFSWFTKLLAVACVYGLAYAFRGTLQEYSPTVSALAGHPVPIIFQYHNVGMLMLTAAAGVLIYRRRSNPILAEMAFISILAYVVMAYQTRTIYLQTLAVMFLLVWYRRASLGLVARSFALSIAALLVITAFGISMPGRLGGVVSLDLLFEHFMSSFGIEGSQFSSAASGVFQRLDWWESLGTRLVSNIGTLLFGLGYGIALTDFTIVNFVLVREPHNSYISVVARLGFIGLFAFAWMQFNLFRVLLRSISLCRQRGDRLGYNRLLLLGMFFVLVLVFALGEDALEKPYNAIPYYFFWGVVLRYSLQLKDRLALQKTAVGVPAAQATAVRPS